MKILFFSSYFYPYTSGITTYPLKILNFLSKNNQVTVLTFLHNKKLKQEEKINRLKIIRIPYLIKISKGFISPQSLFHFFREIKKTDLIIINIPNFEGLLLAILGKLFTKKIVCIFHCQVFLSKGLLNRIVEFFLNLSISLQLSLSNKIIAYTKDYFMSLKLYRRFIKKTIFTLSPIDQLKIDNEVIDKYLSLKKNCIWIGYAGRVAREKGLEYLIEAFSKLKIVNKELVFAGPFGKDVSGEEKYYLEMNKLLHEKKIKYRFLGNLETDQLGSFYKSIDVMVLPSINQTEAFGMVQAEAMVCGTPVVTSNLPGVRAPIQLTKMGIIVQPKNPQQLEKAILTILKNKSRFSNDKLIDHAKNVFNIKKVYEFYTNLIK